MSEQLQGEFCADLHDLMKSNKYSEMSVVDMIGSMMSLIQYVAKKTDTMNHVDQLWIMLMEKKLESVE